ncbi:MAG: diaminopimelate decarboxylase [Myxococcales bacterium]|nr:diaminopimelate decarboxylase [Myxococcales bacterium]
MSDTKGLAPIPPSAHFRYRNGSLHAEDCNLAELADRFGTPSYVYSGASIDGAVHSVDKALEAVPHRIAYAVKANSNLSILRRLAERGCGADIVSGGELQRALRAGFDPATIVFSGVGKSDAEIGAALHANIAAIHAESEAELHAITAIARDLGKRARIALRVNPDVDPKTHPYISTGLHSSKFGLEPEVAERLLPDLIANPHLELVGIACHIGSMVLAPEPIADAVEIVARFAARAKAAGAPIEVLDAGGGWPILYGDEGEAMADHARFGGAIVSALERGAGGLGLELQIEPGRAIVGDAGVLLTRVLFTKQQGDKRFVIVDGAMTELIRPALYGAYHAVMPVSQARALGETHSADLVGPVCESGDFLARDRPLPELQRGDLLAIRGAGAYAAVMASTYNTRPLSPEILVDGAEPRQIRRRQSYDELFALEV